MKKTKDFVTVILLILLIALAIGACITFFSPKEETDVLDPDVSEPDNLPAVIPPYIGLGTEDHPYVIFTAEGFVDLMGGGTDFIDSKYYKLGADIDMTGVEYKPIKQNGKDVTVEFDGNGKTLTGLNPTENDSSTHGLGALFTQTKGNVIIKNLTVEGLSIDTSAKKYSGGLVGYSSSGTVTVIDCNVSGSVTYSGTAGSCIGGLVGYQTYVGSIFVDCIVDVDCTVTATPTSGNVKIGGIVGDLENPGTFNNCTSTGTVAYTGEEYIAGEIFTGEIWGKDEKGTSVVINDSDAPSAEEPLPEDPSAGA